MDDVDHANDRAEAERDRLAKLASAHAAHRMQPTGQCAYCGEDVEAPKLFCDIECSRDYDRAIAAGVRARGPR